MAGDSKIDTPPIDTTPRNHPWRFRFGLKWLLLVMAILCVWLYKNRPHRIAPDERRGSSSTNETFAQQRSEQGRQTMSLDTDAQRPIIAVMFVFGCVFFGFYGPAAS
jgi:hypothetical protein